MKKAWLLIGCMFTASMLFAQTTDDLQKLARMQTQRSSFDSAYKTLELALQQKPNDIDLLKDQAYVCYLKRDFANGLVITQGLAARPDADVQCYQMLGMVYKELAEYDEAEKMYKAALKKYPESGVLYSEYGDMLMQDKKPDAAIETWEKGIKTDVNNNSNYYHAALYYAGKNSLVWSLLYGEIFVNIESFTPRTDTIKELLYRNYIKLLSGNALARINAESKGVAKALTDILIKNKSTLTAGGDTIQKIAAIRQALLIDWVNSGMAKQYPLRLFDLHRQLVEAKIFTAYNEWLFGEVADETAYGKWQAAHADEMNQWQLLLHSVVFKIPAGQYYTN